MPKSQATFVRVELSILATKAPFVNPDILPVLDAVAVVVPKVNLSALSSQKNVALLPVEPRSMIIPQSLALLPAPLFSSSNGSSNVVFVLLTVVVVPFTVRSPVTVKADAIVILSANLAPVIALSATCAV